MKPKTFVPRIIIGLPPGSEWRRREGGGVAELITCARLFDSKAEMAVFWHDLEVLTCPVAGFLERYERVR